MTLADWASLAEIIGAIVVTVSLIFVGVQIRKNTIAEQANTLQNSICQDVDMLMSLGISKEAGETLYAHTNCPEKLTDEERAQGRWLFAASVRHWENIFLQHLAGTLSDSAWQARKEAVKSIVLSPGWEEYTNSWMASYMSGPFIEYAQSVRASSTSSK